MTARPDRLPPLPEADWTPQQRQAARQIIDGPRGALISPFVPLLRSPELMDHVQRLGEYLRYRNALGLRLSELAILVVARHASQAVEWAIHAPIALREGVSDGTVEAIARGQQPAHMPADEALVHDFSRQMLHKQQVDDATWQTAVAAFGEKGVMDLVGLIGYYALLAMVMNAAQTSVPPGPKLPALDRQPSAAQ